MMSRIWTDVEGLIVINELEFAEEVDG